MRSSRSFSLLLMVTLGCGGKIVETASIDETKTDAPKTNGHEPVGTTPVPAVPAPRDPSPSSPAPSSVTPTDACEVLCERDARCDTTLPALPVKEGESGDCKSRCDARLAGKCGIDDWLLCYASFVKPNECTPLPPDCKPAFCAWASCAKQPVSNCE